MTTFNSFSIPAVNGTIAVTTTSQRIALTGTGSSIRVANVTATEAFINVGDSTVVAVAGAGATQASDGAMSVPANSLGFYAVPGSATHVAAITAAGTATLRISRGEGA
jgi:hypothetical protein